MAHDHKPPTPKQILANQQKDAERLRQQQAAPAHPITQTPIMTAAGPATVLSITEEGKKEVLARMAALTDAVAAFQSEDGGQAGRPMDFDGKNGVFRLRDTNEDADTDAIYIALIDQLIIGQIKFNGPGVPATRAGVARPYLGEVRPPRKVGAGEVDVYGDNDPSLWPISPLSKKQDDPWTPFSVLILQQAESDELFAFETRSKTGRQAVASLCTRFDRTQRLSPGMDLLVKLQPSGYQDKQYGYVHKPSFVVCGRKPRDGEIVPSTTPPKPPLKDEMSDDIPF
jgi:hypothetical protein